MVTKYAKLNREDHRDIVDPAAYRILYLPAPLYFPSLLFVLFFFLDYGQCTCLGLIHDNHTLIHLVCMDSLL